MRGQDEATRRQTTYYFIYIIIDSKQKVLQTSCIYLIKKKLIIRKLNFFHLYSERTKKKSRGGARDRPSVRREASQKFTKLLLSHLSTPRRSSSLKVSELDEVFNRVEMKLKVPDVKKTVKKNLQFFNRT